jgi:hypothetical protein
MYSVTFCAWDWVFYKLEDLSKQVGILRCVDIPYVPLYEDSALLNTGNRINDITTELNAGVHKSRAPDHPDD